MSPTVSPTPAAVVRASWVVGDCFVRGGQAHGLVLIRPDGTTPQQFTMEVRLGAENNPIAIETVRVAAQPGQVAQVAVNGPTQTPDGSIQCAVLSVVDGMGRAVVAGDPLPPPSDSNPMPGQQGPGAPNGPSVPGTPPAPATPGAPGATQPR